MSNNRPDCGTFSTNVLIETIWLWRRRSIKIVAVANVPCCLYVLPVQCFPSWDGCQQRQTENTCGGPSGVVDADPPDGTARKDTQRPARAIANRRQPFRFFPSTQGRSRTRPLPPWPRWWARTRWREWRRWASNTWPRSSTKASAPCWRGGQCRPVDVWTLFAGGGGALSDGSTLCVSAGMFWLRRRRAAVKHWPSSSPASSSSTNSSSCPETVGLPVHLWFLEELLVLVI